jgi:hypothetical protein
MVKCGHRDAESSRPAGTRTQICSTNLPYGSSDINKAIKI